MQQEEVVKAEKAQQRMAEEQQAKSPQAMKKPSEKEAFQEALAKAESQIRDLSLAQA